ncbi:hypothetical protein FKM82_028234 [Ascaphus truei]
MTLRSEVVPTSRCSPVCRVPRGLPPRPGACWEPDPGDPGLSAGSHGAAAAGERRGPRGGERRPTLPA